jgi:hypothetical protein
MSDKPKTPGQVCYEVAPAGACQYEDLLEPERATWERRAAAVRNTVRLEFAEHFEDIAGRLRLAVPIASIGIGDKPPPPPPPPPAAPPVDTSHDIVDTFARGGFG